MGNNVIFKTIYGENKDYYGEINDLGLNLLCKENVYLICHHRISNELKLLSIQEALNDIFNYRYLYNNLETEISNTYFYTEINNLKLNSLDYKKIKPYNDNDEYWYYVEMLPHEKTVWSLKYE